MALLSFRAAEAINSGDFVCLTPSGFIQKTAVLTVNSATPVGVALDSGTVNSLIRVNPDSLYSGYSGFVPGSPVYLSVISGQVCDYPTWKNAVISNNYSGAYLTNVGYAVSSSGLSVEINKPLFIVASGL